MQTAGKTSTWLLRKPSIGTRCALRVCLALAGFASVAAAEPLDQDEPETDAGVVEPAPSPAPEKVWSSCLEHVPQGATKPKLEEKFPAKGLSGYALPLEVTVEHGKGETVLPQGFRIQTGSDAAKALEKEGFVLPESPEASPTKNTVVEGDRAITTLVIPFVALPKEPGRKTMTLPPVPIAVARASGEIITACTQPHEIVIEDPTASIPNAKPQPNPPPRPQIEEWTLAKQLTIGSLIGAFLAITIAWLVRKWLSRPKPLPPPPPPRPPWEVAIEELRAIRAAQLPAQGLHAEHFDRVSDTIRKYLGGRYGFDGLESTTDEIAERLREVPHLLEMGAILHFLGECDLVKFANVTPSDEECARILELGERIVYGTMPVSKPEAAPEEAVQ